MQKNNHYRWPFTNIFICQALVSRKKEHTSNFGIFACTEIGSIHNSLNRIVRFSLVRYLSVVHAGGWTRAPRCGGS